MPCDKSFFVLISPPLMSHNFVGIYAAVSSSHATLLTLFHLVLFPVRFHSVVGKLPLSCFHACPLLEEHVIHLTERHSVHIDWHVSCFGAAFTPLRNYQLHCVIHTKYISNAVFCCCELCGRAKKSFAQRISLMFLQRNSSLSAWKERKRERERGREFPADRIHSNYLYVIFIGQWPGTILSVGEWPLTAQDMQYTCYFAGTSHSVVGERPGTIGHSL
jgi:hypothetical protein